MTMTPATNHPAPLTTYDLRDLHAWAENVAADANGWAERAEASRGARAELTSHLDAIASQARHVANVANVLVSR